MGVVLAFVGVAARCAGFLVDCCGTCTRPSGTYGCGVFCVLVGSAEQRGNGGCGMGKPLAGLGGVAALFTMGTGAAADVGDGGDAKTWTLTQRVGNPSFLSLPVSFSAFLLVPVNRAGVKTQMRAVGARCRAACNQLLHAGRRRAARAPASLRASAAAASCESGGIKSWRGSCWRG